MDTANTCLSTKPEWRKEFKSRLQEIDATEKSKNLCRHLKLIAREVEGPIVVFAAMDSEPHLQSLIEDMDKDWVFPKVFDSGLRFFRSKYNDLKPGAYGILEPEEVNEVSLDEIKWCFTPGLGFDRKGHRLGRGKGHYDKAFENTEVTMVGLGFNEQVVDETLPTESHDVLMDWIVTDKYLLKVNGKKSRG